VTDQRPTHPGRAAATPPKRGPLTRNCARFIRLRLAGNARLLRRGEGRYRETTPHPRPAAQQPGPPRARTALAQRQSLHL